MLYDAAGIARLVSDLLRGLLAEDADAVLTRVTPAVPGPPVSGSLKPHADLSDPGNRRKSVKTRVHSTRWNQLPLLGISQRGGASACSFEVRSRDGIHRQDLEMRRL